MARTQNKVLNSPSEMNICSLFQEEQNLVCSWLDFNNLFSGKIHVSLLYGLHWSISICL